ncbi:FAD-binding protein [Shewanella avicenniae]|uniref:FAD-binding protein n=1 Tax=Shewanella avicenniae TaxID=2814294 RepID=A0ABX7QTR1_9GAMM|nr:FAD-binding protein [Shewanella avicenniae]QSX34316.1 FAD-binding protein [Shewanella avicenniae]
MSADNSHEQKALDPYTAYALKHGISRRKFLTGAAAATGAMAASGLTAGMASAAETAECQQTYATSSDGGATLNFLPKPAVIAEKDIASTQSFDVVVVGAGAAGVPAALSAVENGASVACLQKQAIVVSQGNTGSGVDFENSDKAAVEALVSKILRQNAHRPNPALIRKWAYNSGEALKWLIDRSNKAGAQIKDLGTKRQFPSFGLTPYKLNFITTEYGPKPYTTGDGMRDLAKIAEKEGVKFFFNMPAKQLVQDAAGKVIGVIAQSRDGKYHRYLAKKGVILAAGDYQNNEAMCDYFVPDAKNFVRKQLERTGDGFAMAYWAGGVIEPIGHTKILHDFDAGPASMCDMPFLSVNRKGERFVDETYEMCVMGNYLRDAENAGHYSQIFDADYMTAAAKWPGHLVPPEGLKSYMPDVEADKKGVFPSLTNTHVANTLEELAEKLQCDPKTFVASVKRYNEQCEKGRDDDFGKPADKLLPIVKPPFYGIHREIRLTGICSGMVVDTNSQALDADGKPIGGLFIIGNMAGGFYGGADYPMTVLGLSLGRCYTFGYLTGRYVAKL